MRIGVFSDIHGNIYAFEKILESMKSQGIDLFVFCGDICGYYYHQNEIIGMLSDLDNFYGVLGNHDQMFLDIIENKLDGKIYSSKYGKSIELLKQGISNDSLEFLKSLPMKQELWIGNHEIGVFHGSPFNYLEGYVYPDTPIEKYSELPYKYILLGHTHYQMFREVNNRTILNPGSCGQPRDGNMPSYALIDIEKGTSEIINVEYDPAPLIREIRGHNEKNKYLIDILYRQGR